MSFFSWYWYTDFLLLTDTSTMPIADTFLWPPFLSFYSFISFHTFSALIYEIMKMT